MLARRTRWLVAAAAALVLLALVLREGLAWGAALWLRAELRGRGVSQVAIGALTIGAAGARIERLALDGGSLAVERIEVGYGASDLLRGRVGTVRITGARAHGRLGEQASLGALGALVTSVASAREANGGGANGDAPPRLRELVLEDARLELATPRGAIAIPVEASLRAEGNALLGTARFRIEAERENVRGSGRLELGATEATAEAELAGEALQLGSAELSAFSASLRARGTPAALAGELAVRADARLAAGQRATLALPARLESERSAGGGLRVRAVSAEGTLRLPDAAVVATGFEGELEASPAPGEPLVARLRVRELRDLREPARVAPAALAVELRPRSERVEADVRLEAARGRVALRAIGFHDRASGAGEARVSLDPIELGPAGPSLRDVAPALGNAVQPTAGRVEASGKLAWRGAELSSDIEVTLRGVSAQTPLGEIEGLETALRILRPWPLETAPEQRLRAARISVGLPIEAADVRFHVGSGRLTVASAEAALLGGRVQTQGAYDPALAENRFAVAVADVDLALLAARLDLDGLTATGALGGTVPVVIRDAGVFVEGGRLDGAAGGTIHYRPAAPPALPSDVLGADLMLAALRDFRYQELRAQLDGELAGDLQVGLHLRGNNPGFFEGRVVEFNLNLEAPIAAIVRGSRVGTDLPERIRRSLEERQP